MEHNRSVYKISHKIWPDLVCDHSFINAHSTVTFITFTREIEFQECNDVTSGITVCNNSLLILRSIYDYK